MPPHRTELLGQSPLRTGPGRREEVGDDRHRCTRPAPAGSPCRHRVPQLRLGRRGADDDAVAEPAGQLEGPRAGTADEQGSAGLGRPVQPDPVEADVAAQDRDLLPVEQQPQGLRVLTEQGQR